MSRTEPVLAGLLLLSAWLPCAAQAQSTAEQLARINESIALLNAQKAELELKAQIAAKQAEISRSGVALPGVAAGGRQRNMGDGPLPVVRSIEGVDGKLRAILNMGGGIIQSVRPGDKIVGDWTVGEITPQSLSLSRGGEIVRLAPAN